MCKWYVLAHLSFLSVCLISANLANGQTLDRRLIGTFPKEGGPITISTTGDPVVTTGLQFSALSGSITLGKSTAPYEVSKQSSNKVLTEFGFNRVVLSGSVTLDAVASADTVGEASWIEPLSNGIGGQHFSFPFQGGDAARFGIKGSYPYDGGPVTIEPVVSEFPINVRKLEFAATIGTIVTEGNAAPFTTLDATPEQWTASSDVDVLIDGPITLDLNYTSPIQVEGLEGKVWDATGSSSFEVNRSQAEFTRQIRGSSSPNGPILVQSTDSPVALRGLDFIANAGSIIGGENPAPFRSVTANNIARWTLRSDVDVMLDGQLLLDATVGRSTSLTGLAWNGNASTEFAMTQRPELNVEVSYPFDGGPLSLTGPNRANDQPRITGVDLRATAGQFSNGINPAPFESVTNNVPDRWSAESESPIAVPIGNDPPINLDVIASSGTMGTATVSSGPDSITVDISRNEPFESKSLIGGYSFTEGGPVSLASNRPVSLSNLTINAHPKHGKLIAGESAAPFESLTTNSNTMWAADSSSDVTIDGVVELDLDVEPEAFLSGLTWNGTTTSKIVFNGITSTDTNWFIAAYPEDGGKMLLLAPDGPYDSKGVDFRAAPGVLTQGDDPAPYSFFISNGTTGNVTIANLGTVSPIDGVVELDVTVTADTPAGTIGAQSSNPRPDVARVAPRAVNVFMMPNLEKFATPATTCMIPEDELVGDLDDNGTVEFRDFLMLAGNFGLEVGTYAEGDMNCNGTVDFEDFLRLANRFGSTRTGEAQTVPEPSNLGLFLIGFLAMAASQRPSRQQHA